MAGGNSGLDVADSTLTRSEMRRKVPQHGNTGQTCSLRPQVEGGRRADGAEKGVKCRPLQVTGGHCRTLENAP